MEQRALPWQWRFVMAPLLGFFFSWFLLWVSGVFDMPRWLRVTLVSIYAIDFAAKFVIWPENRSRVRE